MGVGTGAEYSSIELIQFTVDLRLLKNHISSKSSAQNKLVTQFLEDRTTFIAGININ
jgi:hypothetical protein